MKTKLIILLLLCLTFGLQGVNAQSVPRKFIIIGAEGPNKTITHNKFVAENGEQLTVDNLMGKKLIRSKETKEEMVLVVDYPTQGFSWPPLDSWDGDFSVTVISSVVYKNEDGWIFAEVEKNQTSKP